MTAFLATAALSSSAQAQYPPLPPPGLPPPMEMPTVMEDDGGPVPAGYMREDRIRNGPVIGGAITFGSVWLATSVFAGVLVAGSERKSDRFAPLFAPVVGPFIAVETTQAEDIWAGMLILNGLTQTAGVAMIIAGIAAKESVFVRDLQQPQFYVTPTASHEGGGLQVGGSF